MYFHDLSLGIVGLSDDAIEMLFINADSRERSIGCALLTWAIEQDANQLDVNQQNPQVPAFYQHSGFEVVEHFALNGQGSPSPILYMHYVKPC